MHKMSGLKMHLLVWMALAMNLTLQGAFAQCNGDSSLCHRRFDEVAFLYTHNSYNVSGLHRLPNQDIDIQHQLERGVRGMMLDIHPAKKGVFLWHGSAILGKRPLQEDLSQIKQFLDSHPQEVISIIFESYVTPDELAMEMESSGLLPFVFKPKQSEFKSKPNWPTLQAMIDRGQRLVIFSEKDRGNPYPWLLHVWDFATENRYSNHALADFESAYNRGDSTNGLYLINHFITHRKFGYGLAHSALLANAKGNVLDHAIGAWVRTGHFPNFIAVDFVDLGNSAAAVKELNNMWAPTTFPQARELGQIDMINRPKAIAVRYQHLLTSPYKLCFRDMATGDLLGRLESNSLPSQGDMLPGSSNLTKAGKYAIELRIGSHFERKIFEIPPTDISDMPLR